MKKILLIIAAFFMYIQFAEAQDAKTLIKRYGDLYFWFEMPQKSSLQNLPAYISVDAVRGNRVYAYIRGKDFDRLQNSGIDFHPIDKAGSAKSLTMAYSISDMSNWDKYPTYDVYVQMMQNFAASYPNITRLDTIGTTQQGRLILVLEITDNPGVDEDEPEFFYTSTMHGDETAGFIFMLRLIDTLLTSYGSNTELTDLVNNMEIWINPLANPDGTYAGGNNDISGATRYLADGNDPNRDFPPPVNYQTPSSPETFEMMDFANQHHFTMSANFHGGAEVANYPWDLWTSNDNPHADDNWWQYVASIYAQNAQNNSPSGYFEGVTSSGIIEGGDWYVVSGSRQDYMNYYKHCREMTVELSNTKLLDVEDLNAYWDYNDEALIAYMKQALYGFHGIVTDGCSGAPIVAKIEILNHDRDGSEVYSSPTVGDWHRPVYAGTYDIQITAPGYDTVTYSNITINNEESVLLDTTLNPLPPVVNIEVDSSNICNGEVVFLNHTTGGSNFYWDFGDGTTSTEENPIHVYEDGGTYTVHFVVSNSCGQADSTDLVLNVTRPAITYNDVYFCGTSDVSLIVNGDGTTYWYADSASTMPLYTGHQLELNGLDHDTVFYVENVVEGQTFSGGENRINTGGSIYSSYPTHGLYFNVYTPVTLVSVDMNAGSDGDREIRITDKTGAVIYDTTLFVPQGISTVTLNAQLPIGDSLLIKCATPQADLFRNNTGTSYPYNIGNVVSIITSTADYGYYYFFYNWQVKTADCKSAGKWVGAYQTTEAPVADFTYTYNNGVYQFVNNSTNATTYLWDFGDGSTSTEFEPQHQYSVSGNYTVTLIAESNCGSDTATQDIGYNVADEETEGSPVVFPTMAADFFYVKSSAEITTVELLDITGSVVKTIRPYSPAIKFDLTGVPAGVYVVKIIDNNSRVFVRRLEKIR